MTIDEIMRAAPVIPVLVLEEEMDWAALAETFVAAGLPVLEVTLRTPFALNAIREMSRVPGAIAKSENKTAKMPRQARAASRGRLAVRW